MPKFHKNFQRLFSFQTETFCTVFEASCLSLRLLQNHAWGEKWCRKIWNSVSGVHFLRIFHVSSKIFFQVSEKLSYSMEKKKYFHCILDLSVASNLNESATPAALSNCLLESSIG